LLHQDAGVRQVAEVSRPHDGRLDLDGASAAWHGRVCRRGLASTYGRGAYSHAGP
jgi:hypothetical protein